jgi:hypothetical protein
MAYRIRCPVPSVMRAPQEYIPEKRNLEQEQGVWSAASITKDAYMTVRTVMMSVCVCVDMCITAYHPNKSYSSNVKCTFIICSP